MRTLEWSKEIVYWSTGDEKAFFEWLQSIPGVLRVEGKNPGLLIRLRSGRISKQARRELGAIYRRYGGDLTDLEARTNDSDPRAGRMKQGTRS